MELDQALAIATQIAQGLEAAHRKGVVHRDIKPANIMGSAAAQSSAGVKILDFGLAQLAHLSKITKTDSTVGTVAYMAPEQTKSPDVDHRADIWSLGVLLYEMVTGRLPFEGARDQAVIYSIVNEDYEPIASRRAGVPAKLDRIVAKALKKDPGERYQQVDDMLVDLRAGGREAEAPGNFARQGRQPAKALRPEAGARTRRRRSAWTLGIAAVILAIAGAAFWNFSSPTEAPLEPLRPVPLTSYPGHEVAASFSPDGNQVAFSWNGGTTENFDVYVKVVGPPLRLTTHPDLDGSPVWSPDGRRIAFLRGRPEAGEKMGLYLIPALGGNERKLAETRVPFTYLLGSCLAWSPDSRWLAVCDRAEDSPRRLSVFLLSVDSGERRRLTWPPEDSPLGDVMPAFSPDGRDIVFSAGPMMANSSLWRVPVSGTASPERLPFGEVGVWPFVSRQGNRLAYTRRDMNVNIYRLNLPVADSVTGKEVRLISSSRWDLQPRYSPDGNRIAFTSLRSGVSAIWTSAGDGSNPVQLTSLGDQTGDPRWAPDGKSIAFGSDAEGQFDVYVVDAEGGAPRRLTSDPSGGMLPSWSRDGEWIYFWSNRNGLAQIFKMPAGGGPAQVVTAGQGRTIESPDGQWFYFERGANHSVWRMPVGGGGEEDAEQVLEPSHEATYGVVEEGVYFVPPAEGDDYSLQFLRFATGAVELIHDFERRPGGILSVAPDGRSILFFQMEPLEADIMLVENFR